LKTNINILNVYFKQCSSEAKIIYFLNRLVFVSIHCDILVFQAQQEALSNATLTWRMTTSMFHRTTHQKHHQTRQTQT